jgi:hypothetical protein
MLCRKIFSFICRYIGVKRILLVIIAGSCFCCKPAKQTQNLKEGDILFQTTNSKQAKAIELATHSRFSHVAVLIKKKGKLMAFEAVGPVRFTPLDQWIQHGIGETYSVKRLKDPKPLTNVALQKMEKLAADYVGKDYDFAFNWNDDEMYCSELVYKLYLRGAGISVGTTHKFKDYDFSDPIVKAEAQKRYGKTLPMEETMISPEDIYKSDKLVGVGN